MLATVPKHVDHAARRRVIADALWRVAARGGFEQVSLRHVAAEAGISAGLVQHYFRSKDDMLLFALDSMHERVGARYAAALAELPDPPPPKADVRALLVQLLPLDEQRRSEGHSQSALLAASLGHGEVGERLAAGMRQLREFVADRIAAAGTCPDPPRRAGGLLAFTDGLAAHLLGGYLTADEALPLLEDHLDSLFTVG